MNDVRELPLWVDYEFEADIVQKAAGTGEDEAAAGLGSMTAHVAATDDLDAATIHSSLSQTLTERVSTPGRYSCIYDQTALLAHLAAFDGRLVYIHIKKSGDIVTRPFPRVVRKKPTRSRTASTPPQP
jgi:hypothetical protein